MTYGNNKNSFEFSASTPWKSTAPTNSTWQPSWSLSNAAVSRVFNSAQQPAAGFTPGSWAWDSQWSDFAPTTSTSTNWFSPPTYIAESSNAFWVSCELPGVNEKDVQVIWQGGVLVIRGQKHEAKFDDGCQLWANDQSFGNFFRSIQMTQFAGCIDSQKLSTKWNNGTLEVIMPKVANTADCFVKVASKK